MKENNWDNFPVFVFTDKMWGQKREVMEKLGGGFSHKMAWCAWCHEDMAWSSTEGQWPLDFQPVWSWQPPRVMEVEEDNVKGSRYLISTMEELVSAVEDIQKGRLPRRQPRLQAAATPCF